MLLRSRIRLTRRVCPRVHVAAPVHPTSTLSSYGGVVVPVAHFSATLTPPPPIMPQVKSPPSTDLPVRPEAIDQIQQQILDATQPTETGMKDKCRTCPAGKAGVKSYPQPSAALAAANATAAASLSSSTLPLTCPPVGQFESSRCEFQMNYEAYKNNQSYTQAFILRGEAKESEIFANADLPLARVNAYGFDFDYTIASYNDNVSIAIFKYAQDYLVNRMGYPQEIMAYEFDKSFAIRGLHFDTRTGFILKLDQNGKVQTSTVFKGRHQVGVMEIVEAYRGVSITKDYRAKYLHQMVDLFALSETNLLGDVIQTFIDLKLDHSPDYIYRDVRRAVEHVHTSGILHNGIIANPGLYLEPNPELAQYLLKLKEAGKMTFLLTNSPFAFVDAGMKFMLSGIGSTEGASKYGIDEPSKWLSLFDVVITSARKPAFFTREGNFRRVDPKTGGLSWHPVREFRSGEVYTEGSLAEFTRLTSLHSNSTFRGHNILYFGDHIGADLTAPWQAARWRTCAIVRELSHEIKVQSTVEFKTRLRQLLRLEALIDYGQRLGDEETMKTLQKLKKERTQIKRELLVMFNPSFGSVFRTSLHRTEFFESVGRYADVYTSNVHNFLNYSLQHCFYAKRTFFPHEAKPLTHLGAHEHAMTAEDLAE